jgi:dUTP pyrophosphatase
MVVNFKKLSELAKIPTFSNEDDAGMDFYAADNVEILPGERALIGTGLAWEPNHDLDKKKYLKIEGRSGLAAKSGIVVLGGVVDELYRGEIKIILLNTDKDNSFIVKVGDKIAQGIAYLIPRIEIKEVEDINNTVRGASGFGSSDQVKEEPKKKSTRKKK